MTTILGFLTGLLLGGGVAVLAARSVRRRFWPADDLRSLDALEPLRGLPTAEVSHDH